MSELKSEGDVEQPFIRPVRLDLIRLDGGTQLRVTPRPETALEYAEVFKAGMELPPPDVYFDGSHYWPGDGHQRIDAAKAAGLESLSCTIRPGTVRDAILHAVGANESHGDRRTRDDARNAVETMLRDEEWSKWSDSEIGRRCKVHGTTVGRIRKELSSAMQTIDVLRIVHRNGTTYAQDTSRIGANNGRSTATATATAPESDDPELDRAIRAARANGSIPKGAKVHVTFTDQDAPEPARVEPSDDEFLESLDAIRDQLTVRTRALYDSQALGYRAVEAARVAFLEMSVAPACEKARKAANLGRGEAGPYLGKLRWALRLPHPSQWKVCGSCNGAGQMGKGKGSCPDCQGDGFQV